MSDTILTKLCPLLDLLGKGHEIYMSTITKQVYLNLFFHLFSIEMHTYTHFIIS